MAKELIVGALALALTAAVCASLSSCTSPVAWVSGEPAMELVAQHLRD